MLYAERRTTSRNDEMPARSRRRERKKRECRGVLRLVPLITNLSRATTAHLRRHRPFADSRKKLAAPTTTYRRERILIPRTNILRTNPSKFARTRAWLVCPNRKAKFNHPRTMHRLRQSLPAFHLNLARVSYLS